MKHYRVPLCRLMDCALQHGIIPHWIARYQARCCLREAAAQAELVPPDVVYVIRYRGVLALGDDAARLAARLEMPPGVLHEGIPYVYLPSEQATQALARPAVRYYGSKRRWKRRRKIRSCTDVCKVEF